MNKEASANADKGVEKIMYYNQDNTSSNIKFTPSKDGSYSSSNDDIGTKPTGDPKSAKDFKKIIGKEREGKGQGQKNKSQNISDDDASDVAFVSEEKTVKKAPISLFDLSSNKTNKPISNDIEDNPTTGTEPVANQPVAKQPTVESPDALFTKLSKKEGQDPLFNTNENGEKVTVIPKAPTQEKFTTRFDTEQQDLTYVNPLAASAIPTQQVENLTTTSTQKLVIPVSHIQEIITQMVDHITQMDLAGRSDTTITLKYPPIFEGVNIIVSSFESAKGEFNIAFENLTQTAKQLLDMRVNQEALRTALDEKGYAVHIITTTTYIENPIIKTDEPGYAQRERGEGERQGGRNRDRNQEEDQA